MTPPPTGPCVKQPIGQLYTFFQTLSPGGGVLPRLVEPQEFAFLFSRAAGMAGEVDISETVTGASFSRDLAIPHGTSTDIDGVRDDTWVASDYLDLLKPSGQPGVDFSKAVWNHRMSFNNEDPIAPVIGSVTFTMLNGVSWPGGGPMLTLQWKISGFLQSSDVNFPFSTNRNDFVNGVATGIVGHFAGNDVVRGVSYSYDDIVFYEEAGTDSGLSGEITLDVRTWFAWRDYDPESPTFGKALYNPATGAYALV